MCIRDSIDGASAKRRNKWETSSENMRSASETYLAAAFSRSRKMVVCDGEHFLQSLISMGIAVEINGKSQCYMWPCVSVASAI